jgi:HlyD family secretion protein
VAEAFALRRRVIVIGFLILLIGVGTLVYFGQYRQHVREMYYSGTMEASVQADLSFQLSGRVSEVLVDEGMAVEEGTVIARLDPGEWVARRDQAQANLEKAAKALDQTRVLLDLYRSTLPAEVARAEAGVRALEANLAELEAGYRPQDVERARLAVDAARSTREEARKNKERYEALIRKGTVSEREKDAVDLRYETALKESERAEEAYKLMVEGFRKESISAARARLVEGQAALREARGNLKKIAATEKELEGATAQVEAARAALRLAELQVGYTELRAPFKGVVTSRNLEPGEVISPGREVISLSDLASMDLKLFVGETEVGKVRPGQKVEVRVDSFPGKAFAGVVSYISPEAEFTPKIIQTQKERVKLVYLVKVSVPNPNLHLKPGMPADAWFKE